MNKQSSVQWLFQKLWDTPKDKFEWQSIFQQAKAMHGKEIEEAWYNSLTKADYLSGNEYYKATFEDDKEVL